MYQKVKENKYILKMVVLGDVGVGKTNIIRRILKQEYNKQEETVGVEFAFIDISDIDPDNPDIKLTIQIWDTCNYIFILKFLSLAGAERYRAITTNHIRNADGAFLVYDICNQNSFNAINFWLNIIKKTIGENVVIYLIGNKADLIEKSKKNRKVSKEEAIEFSKTNHFQGFCECSALKNVNINEAFISFYKSLYKKNKGILDQKTNEKIIYLNKLKEKHSNDKCCS